MTYIAKDKNGIFTIKELNQMGYVGARKYAIKQGIPRTPHPKTSELTDRPVCSTDKCKNLRVPLNWHWTSGEPIYRTICQECHDHNTGAAYGLSSVAEVTAKNAGYASVADYSKASLEQRAADAGFTTVADYLNSNHKYRRFKKYCENTDGRLGYYCDYTKLLTAQLEVDHIDGNPKNNVETNLQTLCKMCHCYKTAMNKDYSTPGRKSPKLFNY
jgi:cytochrome c2